jgi:hypothetical protein
MGRLLIALIISSTILIPVTSQAIGFGDLKSLSSKSEGSTTDLSASQDGLVKQYVSAGKSVLDGNSKMAEALGLVKEATAARIAGDSLSEGSTKGGLSDADKVSSDTSTAVAAALKNTSNLDAPAKAKYAEGMLSLAQGLGKYIGMKDSATSFSSGLSGVSPTMLPKLQSGAYIVSSAPSSIKNLSTALSNAISFAKSHDIAVPKDATSALAGL